MDERLRKNDSRDPILITYDYTERKNAHEAALKLVHELFAEPIDLFGEHLAFLYLIKLSKNSFYFVFKFHHIIVDGYSFIPIIASLYHTYISTKCPSETLSAARSKALLSENFSSYYEEIKRSEAYEKSAQFLADQQYWRATFKDIPEPLFAKKALDKRGFSTVSKPIDKALRARLTQISQESNYSLQKLLTEALLVILCRLYGKERIVIGVPRHNRVGKRQKRIVGMFSSIVPFIGQYEPDMSVLDLLKEISLLQRQTYKHGKYPLTRIIREVRTSDLSDRTVIDLVVNYEPLIDAEIDSEFAYSRAHRVSGGEGSFPVEAVLSDYGAKTPMVLKIDYLHAYCKAEEVESLLERLVFILEQISRTLDEKLSAIKLLFPEEERELLEIFNHTEVAYPQDKTVVDLFLEQVSKTPDNLAVVCERASLTYRELDKKSSQLAHYLLAQGIKKEDLVAICMERSLEMIIGILGIIKSGGAYVPLDPTYPRQRLVYVLEDTGSRVLLSTLALRAVVEGYDAVTPLYLDREPLVDYPCTVPEVGLTPENLAYVIYTSGSTGKPKGVMIERKNVVRLFFNDASLFDFNESDVWTLFHSYNFDFSVWEMYGALLHGGKLVVLSKEQTKDPALFCELIQQQRVTVLSRPSRKAFFS